LLHSLGNGMAKTRLSPAFARVRGRQLYREVRLGVPRLHVSVSWESPSRKSGHVDDPVRYSCDWDASNGILPAHSTTTISPSSFAERRLRCLNDKRPPKVYKWVRQSDSKPVQFANGKKEQKQKKQTGDALWPE
jgi:hypothetical protein